MSYIFISYSKLNKDYAYDLADFLQAQGFNIWIDRVGIEYGVNWWNAIVEGLRDCGACIVIMTPESKASDWVNREIFLALDWKKPVFPLLLNGKNWELFVMTQYADVSDGSMPDADLLKRLSQHVTPQRKKSGENKSDLVPEKAQPNRTDDFDVDAAIADFGRVYRAKNWSLALEILGRIRASGQDPTPFDPHGFESRVLAEMEKEAREREQAERDRQYKRILTMADYADNAAVEAALEKFWERFADYDPEKISHRLRPGLTPEQKQLIDRINDPNTEPPERLKIGLRLAEIGDPRPGVGVDKNGLPEMDWVKIPAGEFIYGENNQKIRLNEFYIARYPVTYIQFQAFIEAKDGFNENRWWQGLAGRPKTSGNQQWKIANHPREKVSWYEAIAFCRWLSWQLLFSPLSPFSGTRTRVGGEGKIFDLMNPFTWPVRLPTEQEWERAARGTAGRIYPWGNEYISGYANCDETWTNVGKYNLKQTTAVGIYPQGASQEGVLDMVGNVYEWMLNQHESGLSHDLTNRYARGLRGGSWLNRVNAVRAANRGWRSPGGEDHGIGFRCFLSY